VKPTQETPLTSVVPYPTQAGQVGGHEGVGIVHKLGPGSEAGRVKVGDRVGIKVSMPCYRDQGVLAEV
jgi:threonine dehydrogenase-like Zn-dependent dehydrogenase